MQQALGDVVGLDVEVSESGFEEPVGTVDGIGAAERGLEAHDPPAQLFGVGVVADRGVKGGEGGVEVAGLLVEFGEAGGGVDGATAQILARSFGPLVIRAIGQVPAVGRRRALQGGYDGRSVRCGRGIVQGVFEAPQVAVDKGGVGLVALADAAPRSPGHLPRSDPSSEHAMSPITEAGLYVWAVYVSGVNPVR